MFGPQATMVEVITEIRIPEMTIECNANLKIEKKKEFRVGSISGTLAKVDRFR